MEVDKGLLESLKINSVEDLINSLKKPNYTNYSKHGYDIYLPDYISSLLPAKESHYPFSNNNEMLLKEISPFIYEAAWDLCLKGILRPGVRVSGAYLSPNISPFDGYSITSYGEKWLEDKNDNNIHSAE